MIGNRHKSALVCPGDGLALSSRGDSFSRWIGGQSRCGDQRACACRTLRALAQPAVISPPLEPAQAVEEIEVFRRHPHWQLMDAAAIMEKVWPEAARPGFPRRRLFDLRLAFTMQSHGVTDFATANVKDFEGVGFTRVWNPLLAPAQQP